MTTYYGEIDCQAIIKSKNKQCTNKAYFCCETLYLCGVHSKKHTDITRLPNNPDKKLYLDNIIKERNKIIEEYALINRNNNKKGDVTVSKLHMMKNPEYIVGYMNVFPNYKHQNRKDGFGCMKLSPKYLGPVEHGMPGLPPATTIENYHQFAKFWQFELDDNGNILEQYKNERIIAYTAPPKRHKYDKKTLSQYNNNINIPLFSVYYDKFGNEHRYTYIQCRYFYCHFYEILAKLQPDYDKLQNLIRDGYNINITGYDGYKPTRDLYSHYVDTSKPFGHELVLYSMLTIDEPANYPWNIYYENNRYIYDLVI